MLIAFTKLSLSHNLILIEKQPLEIKYFSFFFFFYLMSLLFIKWFALILLCGLNKIMLIY